MAKHRSYDPCRAQLSMLLPITTQAKEAAQTNGVAHRGSLQSNKDHREAAIRNLQKSGLVIKIKS